MQTPKVRALLELFPLFSGADRESLDALAAIAVRKTWDAKELVVRQGDTDDSLYGVVEGLLQVTVQGSDGREIVLSLLGEGHIFGDLALFDHVARSASVSTLKRSQLLVFPAPLLLETLRSHPEISLRMLQRMAGLVRRLTTRVEELTTLPIQVRLARKLLEIGELCGTLLSTNQLALPPSLSQQHLASHVQATRESINKTLGVWKEDGLIERSSTQLVIRDRKALAALAGLDEDKPTAV